MSESATPTPRKGLIFEFAFAYFCPTIVGKALILYFGLNYSSHPGDGYGYGLALSILLTIVLMSRFIYRYWNSEEIE